MNTIWGREIHNFKVYCQNCKLTNRFADRVLPYKNKCIKLECEYCNASITIPVEV